MAGEEQHSGRSQGLESHFEQLYIVFCRWLQQWVSKEQPAVFRTILCFSMRAPVHPCGQQRNPKARACSSSSSQPIPLALQPGPAVVNKVSNSDHLDLMTHCRTMTIRGFFDSCKPSAMLAMSPLCDLSLCAPVGCSTANRPGHAAAPPAIWCVCPDCHQSSNLKVGLLVACVSWLTLASQVHGQASGRLQDLCISVHAGQHVDVLNVPHQAFASICCSDRTCKCNSSGSASQL